MTSHEKLELTELTAAELANLFARVGVAQDEALLGNQIAKFNRSNDRMAAVSSELKARDGDQRRELRKLYSYDNMQVRLKAPIYTLAIAPLEARRQIEAIAEADWFPQSGDAGMCLARLDDGTFKPT